MASRIAPRRAAVPTRALSAGGRRLLWLLIAGGLVGRVIVAFKTYGVAYDIDSFKIVRSALASNPLHVYSIVNGHPDNRWGYPPGFFPWIGAAQGLANLTGPFHGWIQLPQIAADGAIAWFVQDHLGTRGVGERLRLAAVALVALGPSFWIISGFHGQIDALAILPAVIALWLWERSEPSVRRALLAGVLIGVGAAIKSVPVVMLAALLPSVRSRREAGALVAPAIAIPLIALAPFLVADLHGTVTAIRTQRALPGFGGLSLLAEPSLAKMWLHQQPQKLNSVAHFLFANEHLVLGVLLLPVVAVIFLRRLRPTPAAALLWCAVVTFNPGFGFHYVVWALPFALMAGYLWQIAVVEAALFVPAALLYWHPFGSPPTGLYVGSMIAIWFMATATIVLWTRVTYSRAASSAPRARGSRPRSPDRGARPT